MIRVVAYDLAAMLCWLLFFLVVIKEGHFGVFSLISLTAAILVGGAAGALKGPTIYKI